MEQIERHSSLSSDVGGKRAVTTKTTTVMPYDPNSGVVPPPGTQEEWTTTKRRINHKTKQVETRVQRQIIMEDGKVIADSGPQVTTKTTEDQKSDESEDTKHRKLDDSEVPEKYRKDIGNQVISEKTVTHNVSREAKEENFQYHDESLRELEGKDIHRRAVEAPHELIRIDNEIPQIPRGKLVHFSSKGRKINDIDEIQEVSRLDKDGLLNTETTQTHHHEEYEDDEVPEESSDVKALPESSSRKQLEYGRHDYDDHRSSRTNSSLSMTRNADKVKSKKWRDEKVNSGDESDIVETSEVYRLSDKMRSLKTNAKNTKSVKTKSKSRDDASTQASLSDSDDETHRHRNRHGKHLHEVHERVESRKSTFGTPDKCCDPLEKPQNKYYYGTDPSSGTHHHNSNGEKGFISSNVKTSKFAMENNRVVEDKSFNEDFERSFKGRNERHDVQRDYERFVERTKDHTKGIRDRSMSPMLPPPVPNEYIHRPVMVDHSTSSYDKPARSRSFYDHQVQEYEHHKSSQKSSHKEPSVSYKPDSYRVSSPAGTWTKGHTTDHYSNDYSSSYNRRSNSRTDFPDFAPLSSPLEIKSLTDNAMKSRHISTYN